MIEQSRLLINGEWISGEGGVQVNSSPYSGEAIAEVTLASVQQAQAAPEAGREAFRDYMRFPVEKRSDMLLSASRLIADRAGR